MTIKSKAVAVKAAVKKVGVMTHEQLVEEHNNFKIFTKREIGRLHELIDLLETKLKTHAPLLSEPENAEPVAEENEEETGT
jgi:hypothetical protein